MKSHSALRELATQLDHIMAADAAWCRKRLSEIRRRLKRGQAVDRLVKQVQDISNRVVKAFPTIEPRDLEINPESIDMVVKGMVAVVSAGDGTGKAAAIKHAQVAGKTGTGQWKPAQKQNIAWFAGFVPASNPKYAFAVLYEGAPGETVSGGRKAAPMVKEVFDNGENGQEGTGRDGKESKRKCKSDGVAGTEVGHG